MSEHERDAKFVERMASISKAVPIEWEDHDRLVALARRGAIVSVSFEVEERRKFEAEEARCVAKVLDDHGVPTRDGVADFSLVGRVMAFAAIVPAPGYRDGLPIALREACEQLYEAAEAWKAHGGDEAHRILPHIHPSFNAVYEAYKTIRDEG